LHFFERKKAFLVSKSERNLYGEQEYSPDDKAKSQQQQSSGFGPELMRLMHTELQENPEDQSLPKFDAKLKEKIQNQFSKDLDVPVDEKELWQDLIEREKNFVGELEWDTTDKELLEEMEELYLTLKEDSYRLDKASVLRLIYSDTYDFVVTFDPTFQIFERGNYLYEAVFEACMFTGLCMFMQSTKKIKGTALSQYIYKYSPLGFSDENSPNYFKHEGAWKEGEKNELIDYTESNLRQYNHRSHKSRLVNIPRPEWNGMPEPSEYEYLLFFDIVDPSGKADSKKRGTFKRLKNLHNDVINAISSQEDDKYGVRLERAWEKFQSKLHKLKYEDYLDLCQFFIEHIKNENGGTEGKQTHYGINLYRLEKELGIYEITNNVNSFLKCKNEQGEIDKEKEMDILIKSIFLKGIPFPQVRDDIFYYNPLKDVGFISQMFWDFMTHLIRISRLIVDKFVDDWILDDESLDDGNLDDNWVTLFWKEINGMAEQVLYNPEDVDFSVEPGSQDVFEGLLAYSMYFFINHHLICWEKKTTPDD